MSGVEAFIGILREARILKNEIKAGGGGFKAAMISKRFEAMTKISKTMEVSARARMLELLPREMASIIEGEQAAAKAGELAKIGQAKQTALLTDIFKASSKEESINDLLRLSDGLGESASVADKTAAQAKLAEMYGLNSAKLNEITEVGGAVAQEAVKADITRINKLLYGASADATKEIKLSEITELENVVGKEGLNEINLGEVQAEAFGSGSNEGLVDNIETLDKLKKMSGEEKLTGDSIENLRKDFKLGDESLLSTGSKDKLNKIEGLIENYGQTAKIRKYFKYSPGEFDEIFANFGKQGLIKDAGDLNRILRRWRLEEFGVGAGLLLGLPGAIFVGNLVFGGDETPKPNPLDGRCREEDGTPTKNKEGELCCGTTKANELAVDCGKYIALFNSGESPEILPDAFKHWLGNESSPYCNLGPCSDPLKDPDNCYIKGHGHSAGKAGGFPTYGQKCSPRPEDPACPKSDNAMGVKKNHYSWPYAIENCSECPSGVGEFSFDNIVNPINCRINEVTTGIWSSISLTLLDFCEYLFGVFFAVVVFAGLMFLGWLALTAWGWEKDLKVFGRHSNVGHLLTISIFITMVCGARVIWAYYEAFGKDSECGWPNLEKLTKKCASPPKTKPDCVNNDKCYYDDDKEECNTEIDHVSGMVYSILFGWGEFPRWGIWPYFILIAIFLLLVWPFCGFIFPKAKAATRAAAGPMFTKIPKSSYRPVAVNDGSPLSEARGAAARAAQTGGGGSLPDTNKKQCLGLIVLILLIIFNFLRKQKDKINSYQRNMNEFIQKKTNKINATKTKSTKTTISPNILNENKFKTVIGGQYVSI